MNMKALLGFVAVAALAFTSACVSADLGRAAHDISDAKAHIESAVQALESDPKVAEATAEGVLALKDVGKAIAAGATGFSLGAVFEIAKDLTSAVTHVELAVDDLSADPKIAQVIQDAKAALKDAADVVDAVFHGKKAGEGDGS